jgi:hypothetical protein
MRKLIAIVAVSAVLLASCATAPYVPPSDSNVATLTIRNDTTAPMSVFTFKDHQACTGKFLLHSDPAIQAGQSFSVAIPADRDFGFWIYHRAVVGLYKWAECQISGTFVPARAGKYLARFSVTPDACRLALAEERNTAGGGTASVPDKTFRLREFTPTFSPDGPFCR